jgi:hypothetical protein
MGSDSKGNRFIAFNLEVDRFSVDPNLHSFAASAVSLTGALKLPWNGIEFSFSSALARNGLVQRHS